MKRPVASEAGMHMQQGIGRAGYRLLAVVFFLLGLGGLGMVWTAIAVDVSTAFQLTGLVTSAFAQMCVLVIMFILSRMPSEQMELESMEAPAETVPAAPAPAAPAPAAPAPAAPAPVAPAPVASMSSEPVEFEYTDVESVPRAAPTEMIVPPAFQKEVIPVEHEIHPVTHAPTPPAPTPPAPPAPEPRAQVTEEDRRRALRDKYTQNTPMMREMVEVPEVRAQRAPPDVNEDWMPDGKMRGKCSKCSTIILAPTKRPIKLRCPVCGNTSLLE